MAKKGKKLKKGVHGTFKLTAVVAKDGTAKIKQEINHLSANEVNSILSSAQEELAKEVGGPDPADIFANILLTGLKGALKDRASAIEEKENISTEGAEASHESGVKKD